MPRLAGGGSPPAARCAAGPRTRRDGRPPGLPARAAITHAHYAARVRPSHPPLPGPIGNPQNHPPGPPGLCASIHPVPSLFVPLCVNHSHSSFGAVMPRHRPPGLPAHRPRTAFLLYHVKTANRVQPHRENQQNGSRYSAKCHSDRNALFQIRASAPSDKPPENNRDEPTRTLDNVA